MEAGVEAAFEEIAQGFGANWPICATPCVTLDAIMSKPTEMDPRPIGAICHKINVTWGDCDPARIVYTGRLPWFALGCD